MCNDADIADPTENGVWWKDDTKWVLYSPENARCILRAKEDGDPNIVLGSVKSSKYSSGKVYAIDLVAMKQTNVHTGFSRDIKIINSSRNDDQEDVEYNSQSFKAQLINQSKDSDKIVRMVPSVTVDLEKLASQCTLGDECNLVLKLPRVAAQSNLINSLTKKTLQLLLEKLTKKDFIKNVVTHKMQNTDSELVWKVCQCQPYVLGRVDNPSMYGSFLALLCKLAEEDHALVDNLFSVAEKGSTAAGDPVEYLFNSVVPLAESKMMSLPRRLSRVLPLPSEGEGSRVSVHLAISQFVQGKRDLTVAKGAALNLADLVSVGHFDYSF